MYRYQLEKRDPGHFLHVGDWESCLAVARQWSEEQGAVTPQRSAATG